MPTLVIILGVLLLAAAGAAGWLGAGRARARAQAAGEAEARDRAEREAIRLRSEWDRERARSGEHAAALGAARAELAALGERAHAEREAARERLEAAGRAHEAERRAAERVHAERMAAVEQARQEIERRLAQFEALARDSFGALAGDALRRTSEEFLTLAKEHLAAQSKAAETELERRRAAVDELVRPIAETLRRTDEKLAAIEKDRTASYAGLAEQVRAMASANEALRGETGRLVKALSKPEVRGRYGEIQLRRVAELAGMTGYCDFAEQSAQRDTDGRLLRPDMVVRLPNGRVVAVDAKTNTYAYIEAVEASTPEGQAACLERFAQHVTEQVTALARKQYWAEFDASPEFVVMFVPGDQFLDAALARRPALLELAAEQGVILASPSTLIGLLRAVAVGWREKRLEDQARELFQLGRQLHERAATAMAYAARLGEALGAAVARYNEFVGSYQSRLEPTLRRFEDAGAKSGKELAPMEPVTVRTRALDGARAAPGLLDGLAAPERAG